MGDYTGITALNGRVYGVWTEKPETKSSRDTIIRIGVADFRAERDSKVGFQTDHAAKTAHP
jgi:hypothetical protein